MVDNKKRLKWLISKPLVLIGHLRCKPRVPVLLYHSVDTSGSVISISPRTFYSQMAHLQGRGYRTLSLHEYVRLLTAEGPAPERAVVITFDDGFKNNYTEAFPILKAFGFSCTIFLATDFVGKICAWERHSSIGDLPMLSWGEIREMQRLGIEFGSHGCSHAHLTHLSESGIKRELIESKSVLERELDKPIRFFCHPYGDVSELTQQLVRDAGYAGAFGSLEFSSRNGKADLYNLKRVGTARFSNLDDFRAGLLGAYDGYVRLKERLSLEVSAGTCTGG